LLGVGWAISWLFLFVPLGALLERVLWYGGRISFGRLPFVFFNISFRVTMSSAWRFGAR
jgi:hypothetical protein